MRNAPEGSILPWRAIVARLILIPKTAIYHYIAGNHCYDPRTDIWTIYGIRYSGLALRQLAKAKGEIYRITSNGETLTLERLYDREENNHAI